MLNEEVQQKLHAEVVDGTAEENRRHLALDELLFAVVLARHVQQLSLLQPLLIHGWMDELLDFRVIRSRDLFCRTCAPFALVGIEMQTLRLAVIDAFEVRAIAQRPSDWYRGNAQHLSVLCHRFLGAVAIDAVGEALQIALFDQLLLRHIA